MTKLTTHSIPFQRVTRFSQIDIDYTTDPASFSDFISFVPTLSNFGKALANRSAYTTDRELLVSVLAEQYAALDLDSTHCSSFLDDGHFTVVTAHQPSLLTGPLYFIYKICSAIHLARALTEAYPVYRIHPVFVLSGEDHDFAEVNHLRLFGHTYRWETDQRGAVGRMKVDEALLQLLREVQATFGHAPHSDTLRSIIHRSFRDGVSYAQAMQRFVIELFAGTGLIVLNMDDIRLKRHFSPVVHEELAHQTSRKLIHQSQNALSALGYKPQTYQREVNLFYLTDQVRGRIEDTGDRYVIVDTELSFSHDEMRNLVDEYPERFSPNVNLRPVYQEMVLPNLAYIGGGGELAYWLERKLLFDHFKIPMPILVRRNSVLYLDPAASKQCAKLELPFQLLFENLDAWIAYWIRTHAEHEIEVDAEYRQISSALDSILTKANATDPTIGSKVEAEKVRILKDIEHMGKRLVRAEKQRNETRIAQIQKLYERLFPENALQERHDNFIAHYLRGGTHYLHALIAQLDPLFNEVLILEEDGSVAE